MDIEENYEAEQSSMLFKYYNRILALFIDIIEKSLIL